MQYSDKYYAEGFKTRRTKFKEEEWKQILKSVRAHYKKQFL